MAERLRSNMQVMKGQRVRRVATGSIGTVTYVAPSGKLARVRWDNVPTPPDCSPVSWGGSACFTDSLAEVE
jgi:hypothetical protein